MNTARTTIFFLLSIVFVMVHILAMELSLYWYFWGTDIVMHFWGGILIGFGIYVLADLPHVPVQATIWWVLLALLTATLSWEIFERYFGLYNPTNYLFDTSLDIFLGITGGLLAHFWLARR